MNDYQCKYAVTVNVNTSDNMTQTQLQQVSLGDMEMKSPQN